MIKKKYQKNATLLMGGIFNVYDKVLMFFSFFAKL